MKIAGLIFAGGKSSRFSDGPKEEALLSGRTLLSHVIARAAPQVDILAISRAEESATAAGGLAVVADEFQDCGPLGGLHAGLCWANELTPKAEYLATFACDTPMIPEDLVARLLEALLKSGASAAIAHAAGERHPTLGLWSSALEPLARRRLEAGDYSLHAMAAAAGAAAADFSNDDRRALFNVNTKADLRALEGMLGAAPL
ncbi:MAG: NTP transferase domain-containing protein [Pseudomonadota bacterium]